MEPGTLSRRGYVRYWVKAECADTGTKDFFVNWLRNGHAQALIDGGAAWYEITAGGRYSVEAMYGFSDEMAFQAYLREKAPELRAASQAAFGTNSQYCGKISFSRFRGEKVA